MEKVKSKARRAKVALKEKISPKKNSVQMENLLHELRENQFTENDLILVKSLLSISGDTPNERKLQKRLLSH